jgi:hypothetical protein
MDARFGNWNLVGPGKTGYAFTLSSGLLVLLILPTR